MTCKTMWTHFSHCLLFISSSSFYINCDRSLGLGLGLDTCGLGIGIG